MDMNNLGIIEERVILIKESFEKIKSERDKLLTEVKAKEEEINELKNIIARNESEKEAVLKRIDGILTSIESISL